MSEAAKFKTCSICQGSIEWQGYNEATAWKDGHNAEPVNNGRCCGRCNDTVVIPARLRVLQRNIKGLKWAKLNGEEFP